MKWLLMNAKRQEDGVFTEKELIEIAKNKDERINRRTLVCPADSANSEGWQTIAQCEDLEPIRELVYKDAGELIWPKLPKQGKRSGVFLSFLLPGLGQIYLGQLIKGICIFIGAIIVGVFTVGIGSILIWIVAMVDANKIQKKLLSGQPVKQWEFF